LEAARNRADAQDVELQHSEKELLPWPSWQGKLSLPKGAPKSPQRTLEMVSIHFNASS
jgi:hypothetical protein